jgi:GH24 family phage-related lysozyme (muramidase)
MRPGMSITEDKAQKLFDKEIDKKVAELNSLLKRPISQGLYDVLVSSGNNNGFGRCGKLIEAVNTGTDAQVRAAFTLYTYAERIGRVVKWPGLVKRRSAELAYWARYDAEHASVIQIQPPAVERSKPVIKTGPRTQADSPNW